jgi:hypothetical protein
MRKGLGVGLRPAPLLARNHQPGALNDLAHGAHRWPHATRLVPLQNPLQLPRSPRHVSLAQTQHRFFDRNRCLVGMTQRSPVQLQQPFRATLTVTADPDIARLPADPKSFAQSLHRLLIALILKHKAQLLLHHTARSPAHLHVVINAIGLRQCQISPRFDMSAMSPVRTQNEYPTPPCYIFTTLQIINWITDGWPSLVDPARFNCDSAPHPLRVFREKGGSELAFLLSRIGKRSRDSTNKSWIQSSTVRFNCPQAA